MDIAVVKICDLLAARAQKRPVGARRPYRAESKQRAGTEAGAYHSWGRSSQSDIIFDNPHK